MPFTEHLDEKLKNRMYSKWPGPHTWLVSSSTGTPKWLLGPTGLIALRLSNHKTVVKLTETLGMPICSTSANLSGNEPAKDSNEIRTFFKDKVLIIEGKLGDLKKPTPVQDLESEEWLRKIKLAVIGSPISHSRSPEIHQEFADQAGIDIEFSKVELSKSNLDDWVHSFFLMEAKV